MGAEYQHNKYGITASKATALSLRGVEPPDAWRSAAISVFPDSLENQNKGCPKATFLGLAEAGYIVGIQPGKYTNSVDNKRYAIEALRLLQTNPALAGTPNELWRRASRSGSKKHNEQMHVVISLWNDRKFVCQQKARQA